MLDLVVLLQRAVLELPEVVVDQVVPADLVVEAELLDLLSRQSFSAATARTIRQRTAPYDLAPKSR